MPAIEKKKPSNAFLGIDYICKKESLYILLKEKIYKTIKNFSTGYLWKGEISKNIQEAQTIYMFYFLN